ncbi:MAG: CheR family methyltransferase [Planctomycetota bacterium]
MSAEAPLLDLLAPLLRGRFGLNVAAHRRVEAERKIKGVLGRARLDAPEALARALAGAGLAQALLEDLVEELAIGETSFFRDSRQLALIEEELLGRLARELPPGAPLRVWSAGCATGEEAFTLALLLERAGCLAGRTLEVIGTDIVEARLARARAGRYGERALARTPLELRQRYFEREGEVWRVARERLRCSVRFRRHNLLDPAPLDLDGCALVLCRNVLIYFDAAADRARILEQLAARLHPAGYLLLGHAEAASTPRLQAEYRDGVVFHRLARSASAAPARGGTSPAPISPAAIPASAAPRELGQESSRPPRAAPASSPPLDVEDLLRRAGRLSDAGDEAGAEALARAGLERAPDEPRLYLLLAVLREARGELEAGLELLQAGLYRVPTSAALHASAARLLEQRGLLDQALRHRRDAHRLALEGEVGP